MLAIIVEFQVIFPVEVNTPAEVPVIFPVLVTTIPSAKTLVVRALVQLAVPRMVNCLHDVGFPSILTEIVSGMRTLSVEVGTPFGLQVVAEDQFPLLVIAVFSEENTLEVKIIRVEKINKRVRKFFFIVLAPERTFIIVNKYESFFDPSFYKYIDTSVKI